MKPSLLQNHPGYVQAPIQAPAPVVKPLGKGARVKLTGIDPELVHSPCVGHPKPGSKGRVTDDLPPKGKVCVSFPARTPLMRGSSYDSAIRIFVQRTCLEAL